MNLNKLKYFADIFENLQPVIQMNVLNKHHTIWNFCDDFPYDVISKWKNIFSSFRADFVFDFGCMTIQETTVGWPCLLTECPVPFAAVPNHIQAAHCSPLPHPKCKPDMNENRDNSKMFSALRLPLLATNRNQASSTAQCGQCLGVCMVTWSDTFFSL